MPYLSKDKQELSREDLNMIKTSHDEQTIQAGISEAYKQYDLHQKSVFQTGSTIHEDSKSMERVKEAENNLFTFYEETGFSDVNTFMQDLDDLKSRYQELIGCCYDYIKTHKRTWTASGKARKQMVTRIQKIAEYELSKLDVTAEAIYNHGLEEHTSWRSVLGVLRTANIDMDEHQVEKSGGGTSEVKIISYDDTKLFFKKEELLLPMTTDVKKQLENDPACQKHKKVLDKLLSYVNDNNHMDPLSMRLAKCPDYENLPSMLPDLFSEFSKKEQEALQEIMPAFAPVFSKVFTRYGTTAEAKIGLNQDLTKRNIATSRMAGLLGLSNLVTDAVPVSLHSKHAPEEKGVATVMAKGSQLNPITSTDIPVEASPEVVKNLINLQLLDFLCGQVDRNTSNLFFTYEERDGKRILTNVTGIDSDMAFGLLSYDDLNAKESGLLQAMPIEYEGNCKLPFLDEELCERILALNQEAVNHVLSDLLNQDELDALWNRIAGMQTMLEKNRHLMKEGAWNNDDIRILSDGDLKTYYTKISSNLRKPVD